VPNRSQIIQPLDVQIARAVTAQAPALNETTITVTGNLADHPELRFTPSGQATARFHIASTPRFYDEQSNSWEDGESLFLTCHVLDRWPRTWPRTSSRGPGSS